MDYKKKLKVKGILFLFASILVFSFICTFFSKKAFTFSQASVIIMCYMIHLITNWYILYKYSSEFKKIVNRLSKLNIISIIVNSLFLTVYIILIEVYDIGFKPKLDLLSLIGLVYIVYEILEQENNTHSFLNLNIHKLTKQTKREYNVYTSFIKTLGYIFVLWISLGTAYSLNFYGMLFLSLFVLQRSLAYTTFAQSKYWNFVYELCFAAIMILMESNQNNLITITIIIMYVVVFLIINRQWFVFENNSYGFIFGNVFLGFVLFELYRMKNYLFEIDTAISAGIIIFCIMLVYLIGLIPKKIYYVLKN